MGVGFCGDFVLVDVGDAAVGGANLAEPGELVAEDVLVAEKGGVEHACVGADHGEEDVDCLLLGGEGGPEADLVGVVAVAGE